MCITTGNVRPIFPHRQTLEEVRQEALAALPIVNPNELMALLELQKNTIRHISELQEVDHDV
jgi:hypothetical protein